MNWFRVLWVVIGACAAGLSFFLAGAAEAGVDPMARLILGAVSAALAFVLAAPTILARSSIDPGKSEKSVAREAALTGRVPGDKANEGVA